MKHKSMKSAHKAEHRGMAHKKGSENIEPESWGRGEFANMPQAAVMSEYPRNAYGDNVRFRDDISRLTDDAKDNERIWRSNVKRGMY